VLLWQAVSTLKIMYAIIYWIDDSYRSYVLTNFDKTIKLFDTLEGADVEAELLERRTENEEGVKLEARVISIEGVKE